MRYSLLIGSHARGDFNDYSDCDVLLIGMKEEEFDTSILSNNAQTCVNFVVYDEETFQRLYDGGSLFIYHALMEGVLIEGDHTQWETIRNNFKVQSDYRSELFEIINTTNLLANTKIFGGKYLTPLVNAFVEVKNACIFSLAHKGVFEFNKSRCFDSAIGLVGEAQKLKELKLFYDYSIRNLDVALPFNPNDEIIASQLLVAANTIVKDMYRACK